MPEPIRKRPGLRPAEAAQAAKAGEPSGASRRPALRRASPPSSAGTGPLKKKKNVLPLAIGSGAVLLLVVVLLVVMSGGKSQPEEPAPPATTKSQPTPKKSPSDANPLPPDAKKLEAAKKAAEDDFVKAREEAKKFALEQEKKHADREKKQIEAREREAAEKKKEKEEAEVRTREALAGYDLRKRARHAESAKHLEEAKKAIEEDRKAEIARQKALVEKLKTQKLTLKLRNGMQLQNVIVQGMTRDEIKLSFNFEGASVEQAFPVEFIDDRSYVDLLGAIYKGDGPSGLYEMGRHLVLRKLWKDAKAVFDDCVKADSAYSSRVPDLSRILHNEAAFKGSARRVGADQLYIAYDFSDAAQAQDFQLYQPGRMSIEGGELRLQSPATALWRLKDVEFERDLEVDTIAIFEEKSALIFGGFFTADRKGYLAVVNSLTPVGHVLHRYDGTKIEQLGLQQAPKIVPGAETRIRFQARGGTFRVYIGNEEAIAATDASYAKGSCLLGVAAGTIRIKKLTVQGRVNPVEIDKRFAEVEVLVRRALEADLGKKRKDDDSDVDPLSAEDEYLLGRLDPEIRSDFDRQRSSFVKALQKRRLFPKDLAAFDEIVRKAPEFAAGRYWKAVALMHAKKAEEARGELQTAVRLCPDFHEAQMALAQVALDDRDLEAVAASVRKGLELSPGYGDLVAMGGFLKYLSGDSKGAVADLELARKLDPASDWVATTQKNVLNVLKGPQHLGAKWVKEFPHYLVMTDMSAEKTALYGSRLEAAYKFYSETFKGVFVEEPRRPKPRVAVFNTREAYMTYGELTLSNRQEWTLGYFHPLYKELLLFEDVDPEATLQTLYHEAFHQFMSLMIPRVPFWYSEGIAEYMGGIKVEVSKGQSKIVERARILDGRLKGLKMSLKFALKFEDIMMQTPGQFYSGPVSFKYAQAWSMVHFFYEAGGGKYRPKIEAYFRKLKEGGTPREAFEAGFGGGSIDDLQKEWVEYVKKMEPLKK